MDHELHSLRYQSNSCNLYHRLQLYVYVNRKIIIRSGVFMEEPCGQKKISHNSREKLEKQHGLAPLCESKKSISAQT